MTNEFQHYAGCNGRDPDNCCACALTDTRQDVPNYSGWPLVYMENRRPIPAKWRTAFAAEFERDDNLTYVANLIATKEKFGVAFRSSVSDLA